MTLDTKEAPAPPQVAPPGQNGQPPIQTEVPRPWTIRDTEALYRIREWGQKYFSVNPEGHVAVHPTQDPNVQIDLKTLVDELRERDIQPPLLVRFTDILQHRVGRMHAVFDRAIRENEYKGAYRCVYPIKVNQQRHVVEEILGFGKEYGLSLIH